MGNPWFEHSKTKEDIKGMCERRNMNIFADLETVDPRQNWRVPNDPKPEDPDFFPKYVQN